MIAAAESQVIEAVCEARERRRALEIVGGGTRRAFGRPAACDDVLDVSGLRGIVNYEPEELIVTLKPGTLLEEVEQVLSEKGQRLGFDPVDWSTLLGSKGTSTIGGAISADACGSAAMRYGRSRDHLLGFRAVNGFGEAYKGGGKVVKNVTGFDLPKLMCGAMGTLGVLTEVTLRVFPKAEISAVYAATDIGSGPGLALLRQIAKSPLEATGLSYLPEMAAPGFPQISGFGAGAALVRFEGASDVMREKRAMLESLWTGRSVSRIADDVFRTIGSGSAFADGTEDLWLLSLPASRCAEIAVGLNSHWLADWAGGRLWCRGASSQHEPAAACGGTATLMRAGEQTRLRVAPFHPEEAARAALTRAVKSAFDPLGLFNPGRMYEGV